MKKLMVAMAAVAVGLAAQAAVVDWQYTISNTDTRGGLDYSNGYSLYLVDAAGWDALGGNITKETFDSDVVYGSTTFAAGTGKSASNKTFASNKNGTTTAGLSNTTLGDDVITDGGTHDFYYVVVKNDDGDPAQYYQSATATLTGRKSNGNPVTANALTIANSTVAAGWKDVGGGVPEPTTGLLMLVGLAGLALRRRCA